MNLSDKTDWSENDLADIVRNKVEESVNIDFKASSALSNIDGSKKELSKDVSALANCDGGLLFYGINERDHAADSISHVDGRIITKEWLDQVISSNIQRKIEGLRIYPVRFEDDISKTVYVIKVPASSNAPHIAKDKKYYKRYNFESVPMEEYEVRNIYLRRQNSKLEIQDPLAISKRIHELVADDSIYLKISVQVSIKNVGSFPEDYYKVSCLMKSDKNLSIVSELQNPVDLTRLPDEWIISSVKRPPLFPNEVLSVIFFTIEIEKSALPLKSSLPIDVRLFYPGGFESVSIDIQERINFLYNGMTAFR